MSTLLRGGHQCSTISSAALNAASMRIPAMQGVHWGLEALDSSNQPD
jgi:hypothetical protein